MGCHGFFKPYDFPLAAAAAAAKAVNEVPLIIKEKLLPSSGDTCSSVPAACHIHRLSAEQIWLRGGEIMGSFFSLSREPQQAHKTFAQVN